MMPRQGQKKAKSAAELPKAKRAPKAKTAKPLSAQAFKDTKAELRLQTLLHELDKYDEPEDDDAGADSGDGFDSSGPSHHWSDDD